MTKPIKILLLLSVLILAFFLRFWQLGAVPPSLDWDEASIGYNAFTILTSGKDEYGNFLPISIRSFNDYKASVYTYLSAIPIGLLGLNEYSVRFTSALLGSLTVLVVFILVKKLVSLDKNFTSKANTAAMLTAFLLAISPWHIQFSRVAFEANAGLFFFCASVLLFILAFENSIWQSFSVIGFGCSIFSYHSYKVLTPLFVLAMTVIYFKRIKPGKILLLITVLIAAGVLVTLVYSFHLGSQSRALTTSALSLNRGIIENLKIFLSGYLSSFNVNFLFVTGDLQLRHHAPGMAQLYLWELPFVIAGIVYMIKKRFAANRIIFLWFLLVPVPAAVTKDVPNAVRVLSFLPIFQLFTAFGILGIYDLIKKKYRLLFGVLVSAVCFVGFIYFFHMYFVHGPLETSQNWIYGYKQVVEYVNEEKYKYDKVVVTDAYDQPYIYFLFFNRPAKIIVNNGELYKGFENIEFRKVDWQKDMHLTKTLIVGTPGEISANDKVVKEINFLDGSGAFRIAAL